ncbi:cobyrinic acid a,c-diamide synthase [Rhodoferax koreense]|uniref:Cobyrinic acid a,c-diamide synthase n=1 Tax=Rhodoferax koreensis TaxID=1842727 RepID=A0A1P8JVA6_9BURK|nr:cobyrinate a,c-diamide synthase [Rhodoferax koreense]APW37699.1 cobyrinic acid a,c-diamide synthase [Rhodoferax koreense]
MGEALRCPAVLVAAPASGQGKTTVASALARLHTRRGLRVAVFKCGPDFLDPFWLSLAAIRPGEAAEPVHQLDLWMTGEADCAARLRAAARSADLVIVEGVMGLFDGTPSAADLARRFALPVLAVIDASAMAGTFGALAFGLQHFQPGLRWAGVLANRVAGARHAELLQAGLRADANWLGALLRNGALSLPERHLGLVGAGELADAAERLDAAADALAETPLGRMTRDDLRAWDVDLGAQALALAPDTTLAAQPLRGRTVAVARDAAFCFIYAANLDCLRALGARLVFFSPLAGDGLPPCDAVWLPGGYPELHAPALSANTALRDDLARHVARGQAVWAECGGMMVLFETLHALDGASHAMWGLLPGTVRMQARLAALGQQQLALDGQVLRGHTFHYSTSETPLAPMARSTRPGSDAHGEAVYATGSLRASYFHAWFPSSPRLVAHFFGAARATMRDA